MKRQFIIMLMAVLVTAFTGCGSSTAGQEKTENKIEENTSTEIVNEKAEQSDEKQKKDEEAEKPIGMPNPIVEVSGDEEFSSELGIKLDTTQFPGDVERCIINKEIAQVVFGEENADGDIVECCFRGTKNSMLAHEPIEGIAGIYSSDISDETEIDMPIDNGDSIMFKTYHDNENILDIAYWKYENVYYTMTTGENISQMSMAELYDSALRVIGANKPMPELTGKVIEPMEAEIDLEGDLSGTFYATLESLNNPGSGQLEGNFSIYAMDLYAAEDINGMKTGDIIIVDGENVVVETVVEDEPLDLEYRSGDGPMRNFEVNGGLTEGGVDFIEYMDGTYRYFGWDDMATYTCVGTTTLPIADNAVITDHMYDYEGTPDGRRISTGEFVQYYEDEYEGSFRYNNTSIKVENGVVTELTRVYVP